eukprot:scaffold2043_cov375-Prasinococcus_capsulatus_cf.AAC.6
MKREGNESALLSFRALPLAAPGAAEDSAKRREGGAFAVGSNAGPAAGARGDGGVEDAAADGEDGGAAAGGRCRGCSG